MARGLCSRLLNEDLWFPQFNSGESFGTHLKVERIENTISAGSRVGATMEGFNSLDLFHKSNILKEHATWLITLEIEDFSVKLYSWDRFFIEQYFSEEMRVAKINIAQHNDMLKYLSKISLSDLGNPTVV